MQKVLYNHVLVNNHDIITEENPQQIAFLELRTGCWEKKSVYLYHGIKVGAGCTKMHLVLLGVLYWIFFFLIGRKVDNYHG